MRWGGRETERMTGSEKRRKGRRLRDRNEEKIENEWK
jgi:hypothetical protein